MEKNTHPLPDGIENASDATIEENITRKRSPERWHAIIISVVAIIMTLFQLYTAYFGIFTAFRQRGTHIVFALVLCFLLYKSRKIEKGGVPWYDWILIGLAIFSYGYMINYAYTLSYRHALVTPLSPTMLAVGIIGMVLLVEASRRSLGNAFTLVIVGSLAYTAWGNMLPGLLKHRGYTLMWVVDHLFFTWEGVFGIPAAVSATYVFVFICFANFLTVTGAGDYFIDIAISGFGKYRGGPAKTAIFASGLMGTVSGSAVANVVATGSITIPLMKKIGYKPHFAGAVEAVSSTGGQIMPPVMGAAAFIMAEFTGTPYVNIIFAAIIPALLYYLGVTFQVHFEAVRMGLKGLKKSELPEFKKIFFKGLHYFIPIIIIYWVLLTGRSPLFAGLLALVAVIIVTSFKKESRLSIKGLFEGFEKSARGAVEVAIACAGAGIVVGVVSLTGIGTRLSALIVDLSGGNLLPALIMTMFVAIVLGMGLPPVAAYIIQAALLAPALSRMGVPVLAAHMFVFYYAMLSNITPPVALAAYAAAAVADSEPFQTGVTAVKLGIAAYIVPFMFVYGPALLLIGDPLQIVLAAITAVVGVYGLAVASIGYYRIKVSIPERILFAAAALMLISANIRMDIAGMVTMAVAITLHVVRSRKDADYMASKSA